MPITERLMQAEQWTIPLALDTPRQVLLLLQPFGHIVVTGSAIDPRQMLDTELQRVARFVGIVRNRLNPYEVGGTSLIAWLGDEEGKGDLWEANLVLTARTFAQAVSDALKPSVIAGTISAVGAATVTQSFFIANGDGSTRAILDWIMAYFTGLGGPIAEYRVNNDATLDAGPTTTLFPTATTPKTIFVPWLAAVDPNIIGITASVLKTETDADRYSNRIWFGGAGGSNAQANGPADSYKDLRGNALKMTRVIVDTSTAAGNVGAQAAGFATKYPLRQVVKMNSDRYDVRRDIAPGDWTYVFDPENGLTDVTQTVNFAGGQIAALKLRIFAITWPVETGMGVYYRDGTTTPATYTDLTRYVEWEPPGATFEVGAPNLTLTF